MLSFSAILTVALFFFGVQGHAGEVRGSCLLQRSSSVGTSAANLLGHDAAESDQYFQALWNDTVDSVMDPDQPSLIGLGKAAQGLWRMSDNLTQPKDKLLDDWKSRGYSSVEDYVKYASGATLIMLAVLVFWVRFQDPASPQKRQSYYSSLDLCQMQAFRWYAGFFLMMWLPFLIAQEGERMWGNHQAAFMAICKLIFGVSLVATPLLGALNDRTRLRFGRRRAWFFGGSVLIILGICCTALASVWRNSGMFFLSLTVWMVAEAACDSTSEALVPDLVSKEDYSRAGGLKGGLFSLGGVFGYVLIIVCGYGLHLPYYWMYLAFLFCILMTAPFVFVYTAPTESEVAQLDKTSSDDERLLQTLWFSYIYPLQGPDSENFRKALVASSFYCAGCSSILFILLVCRDVIRPGSPEQVQLHFACVSLNFSLFAVIGAFLASFVKDSVARLYWGKIVGTLYGATELLIPACAHFSSPTRAAAALYMVSSLKGVLYGNILSMFFSLQWDCLPARMREKDERGHDNVAVAMGVAQVGRSLGAGIGNAIFGLVLQFSSSNESLESWNQTQDFHYPISSYYAMFTAAAISTWIGTILLQRVSFDPSQGIQAELPMNPNPVPESHQSPDPHTPHTPDELLEFLDPVKTTAMPSSVVAI